MAAAAEKVNGADVDDELVDYEEEETNDASTTAAGTSKADAAKKGGYVGIHSSGFKDFLLKPELLRSIQDCGFEHPSEGEQLCIASLTGRSTPWEFFWCCYEARSDPGSFPHSSTRVYTSSHPGNGRSLPGQVWHGQDSCLCPGNLAAARAKSWRNLSVGLVPHA